MRKMNTMFSGLMAYVDKEGAFNFYLKELEERVVSLESLFPTVRNKSVLYYLESRICQLRKRNRQLEKEKKELENLIVRLRKADEEKYKDALVKWQQSYEKGALLDKIYKSIKQWKGEDG